MFSQKIYFFPKIIYISKENIFLLKIYNSAKKMRSPKNKTHKNKKKSIKNHLSIYLSLCSVTILSYGRVMAEESNMKQYCPVTQYILLLVFCP